MKKQVILLSLLCGVSIMNFNSAVPKNQAGMVGGYNQEEKELLQKIAMGDLFKHYSGKEYKIAGIFRHSEDLSLYVAYEGLYEDKSGYGVHWIRPLAMFLEEVEINGVKQPRFKKIN